MVEESASEQKEASMAETDFKVFIEKLVKKIHLEQMNPDVKERFDSYKKDKDFVGHMKDWEKDLAYTDVLDEAANKAAYKAFLAVFENMSDDESSLNKQFKERIYDKFFGDNKVFNHPEPIPGAEAQLTDFYTKILANDENEAYLTKAIEDNPYILRNFDDNQFNYEKFRKNIKDGKYKTDPKVRKQVISVVNYIRAYPTEVFPEGSEAAEYKFDKYKLPANAEQWFEAHYHPGFQFVMPGLVSTLTRNAKFREEFKKYDHVGTISSKIEKGLEKTAFDDEKSEDYIPPVYKDEKKFLNKVKDKVHDFWDNNLRQFTDVLRGTRVYMSPYSQTIIKTFDSIKNKDGKRLRPVDGIKGILENKEKIIAKIQEKSPSAKKHFEWFAKKMDTYSKKMPDAFDGALRNAKQLRKIVSRIIVDAIHSGKDDDIEAAKTSMEILSVMKYGIMHSRTLDAMNKEDLSVLSQTNIAKKYELVGALAKGFDWAAKKTIILTGRGVAAIRNGVMRRRTKFNGNMADIDVARNQMLGERNQDIQELDSQINGYNTQIAAQDGVIANWATERTNKETIKRNKEASLTSARAKLTALETRYGGREVLQEKFTADSQKYQENMQTLQSMEREFLATAAGHTPAGYTPGTREFAEYWKNTEPQSYNAYVDFRKSLAGDRHELETIQKTYQNVNNAQQEFDKAEQDFVTADSEYQHAEQDKQSMIAQRDVLTDERSTMADDTHDKYLDLMSYWDTLESFGKTHSLRLAINRVRKKKLAGFDRGTSQMQQMAAEEAVLYKERYGRAG